MLENICTPVYTEVVLTDLLEYQGMEAEEAEPAAVSCGVAGGFEQVVEQDTEAWYADHFEHDRNPEVAAVVEHVGQCGGNLGRYYEALDD